MRLGLCCLFAERPIRFRTTTAKFLGQLRPAAQADKLRGIAADNAAALLAAIEYCADHDIGCFRVNSQILPLRTHPKLGYDAEWIGQDIVDAFRSCGSVARETGIRLSFHPDQFVVLSSPKPSVVDSSLAELEAQAEIAEWIGADVINVHGGGGYGDKPAALRRLTESVTRLSDRARERLTFENDDRIYAPSDLLPVCRSLGVPLVYDVHHHRCHGDGLRIEAATELAMGTWNREPLFHISSPRDGWDGPEPRRHSDTINLRDLPRCWEDLAITVEVEAKAKEIAVRKLARALKRRARRRATRAPSPRR